MQGLYQHAMTHASRLLLVGLATALLLCRDVSGYPVNCPIVSIGSCGACTASTAGEFLAAIDKFNKKIDCGTIKIMDSFDLSDLPPYSTNNSNYYLAYVSNTKQELVINGNYNLLYGRQTWATPTGEANNKASCPLTDNQVTWSKVP